MNPLSLGSIREGSIWCWMPLNPRAKCLIKVVSIKRDCDDANDWLVEVEALETRRDSPIGSRWHNEVSRFVEACVLVSPSESEVDVFSIVWAEHIRELMQSDEKADLFTGTEKRVREWLDIRLRDGEFSDHWFEIKRPDGTVQKSRNFLKEE